MNELPRTWKLVTVWLLLGTVLFLAIQAWQSQQQRSRVLVAADGAIELRRGPDRHFHWPGQVNGQPVDFLVDTGATGTALPESLARTLGLVPEGQVQTQTAGGLARGWSARATVELEGGVVAQRLRVTVLPQLEAPLLGMDVLGRLHFSQQDGVLRLQAPR
jgi:aspartyl protease family protein